MSNTEWQNDQGAPYRQQQLIPLEPIGHPLLDQAQGQLLDPSCKVTVYEKQHDGSWRGCMRVVIRSSRTHLEHKCPTLGTGDIKITTWGEKNRWLAL